MRTIRHLALLVMLAPMAWANQSGQGFCTVGAQKVTTSGIISSTQVQASYPQCTVTVYDHGTVNLSTIYSDNASTPTPLANPFTATTNGSWKFYAAYGHYDIVLSGAGFPTPFTISDYILADLTTPNPGTNITVSQINNVPKCDNQTGSDVGAKAKAAMQAAIALGVGLADCTGILTGTVGVDMFGSITAPVTVMFNQAATFTVTTQQNLKSYQKVMSVGPTGFDLGGSTIFGTKFTASSGIHVFDLNGAIRAEMENITVDCTGTANCVPLYIHNNTGGDGNLWRVHAFNAINFTGCGVQIGDGGAGGGDTSQGRIEGPFTWQGATGNTTAAGSCINSINADQGMVIAGPGHIRHVQYGIDYQYGTGGSRITDLVFGDPTGTSPAAFHFGTIGGPVTVANNLAEGPNSAAANDVTYSSILYTNAGGSATFTLRLQGNRLHFPVVLSGPVSVESSGNTAAYGPWVVDNVNASVESIKDQIGYSSGDFNNSNLWTVAHVYAKDDLVLPTSPNGYYYRVSVAGTAGAEPVECTTPGCTSTSGITITNIGEYPGFIPHGWARRSAGSILTESYYDGTGIAYNGAANLRMGAEMGFGDAQFCYRGGQNGDGNVYFGNCGNGSLSNGNLRFQTNNTDRWLVIGGGDFWPATDKQRSVGSATSRLLYLYMGSSFRWGTASNTDTKGSIVLSGAGAGSQIFSITYPSAPSCTVTSRGGHTFTYSMNTTSLSISGGTAADTVDYNCHFE